MAIFLEGSLTFSSGPVPKGKVELNEGTATTMAVPGLVHTLENIIYVKSEQAQKLELKVSRNPKIADSIKNSKSVELHPDFLSNLLLHSESKYINLAKAGECQFYALLENDLLKMGQDSPENLVVDFINDKNKRETALLPKKDYLQYIYQSKCINNKEIQTLFTLTNFSEILQKIALPTPKSEKQCVEILQQWEQNPYTPYICKISEIFQTGKRYSKELPFLRPNNLMVKRKYQEFIQFASELRRKISNFQYTYINNLCENISRPQHFCEKYLSNSFWDKILNGEKSPDLMKYRCQYLLKKETLNKGDYNKCRDELESNPKSCHYLYADAYPSLVPKPHCKSISKALQHSNLKNFYQDCPSRTDNEGIISTFRILSHLENRVLESNSQNCASAPAHFFSQLIFDFGQDALWKFKACYYDILEEKDICYPLILGEFPASELAENKVISKILIKSQGASENLECKIVEKKKYKPLLLQFRRGCFLIYEGEQCTAMNCPKKIIYNEKEVTSIKYFYGTNFSYFPINLREEQYAISSILRNTYKYKTYMVRNLTELKAHLDAKGQNIVHGMGCAEDLYPSFFKKNSMNQCRPLTFIIDGYFEENLTNFLIIRTSIDENHSPRIITWNYVYSAVKNNQELHHLRAWNLYVIKYQTAK